MKRLIALLVLVAVAAVPASASAKSKSKVYRGALALLGADGDYVTGNFGKVQLVDGKRNDKLSVHVRKVAARTKFTFRLRQGSCGGTDVAGWKYRSLKTSRKGVGNASARSRTFKAAKGVKYFVSVYGGDQLVLCARLSTNGKALPKAKDKGRGHGRSDDKRHGKPKDRGRG